jgi:hypothetical protein
MLSERHSRDSVLHTDAAEPGVVNIQGVASLIWLIVWLVKGTPNLAWFGSWNDWAVALLGCAIFDVFSGPKAARAGRGRAR